MSGAGSERCPCNTYGNVLKVAGYQNYDFSNYLYFLAIGIFTCELVCLSIDRLRPYQVSAA